MQIEQVDGQTRVSVGENKTTTFYLYLAVVVGESDQRTKLLFSNKSKAEELSIPNRVTYSPAVLPDNKQVILNHGGPVVVPRRQ